MQVSASSSHQQAVGLGWKAELVEIFCLSQQGRKEQGIRI